MVFIRQHISQSFLPFTSNSIIFPLILFFLYSGLKQTVLTLLWIPYFSYLLNELASSMTHSSSNFSPFIRSSHSELWLKIFPIKTDFLNPPSPSSSPPSSFSIVVTLLRHVTSLFISLSSAHLSIPFLSAALTIAFSKLPSNLYVQWLLLIPDHALHFLWILKWWPFTPSQKSLCGSLATNF